MAKILVVDDAVRENDGAGCLSKGGYTDGEAEDGRGQWKNTKTESGSATIAIPCLADGIPCSRY